MTGLATVPLHIQQSPTVEPVWIFGPGLQTERDKEYLFLFCQSFRKSLSDSAAHVLHQAQQPNYHQASGGGAGQGCTLRCPLITVNRCLHLQWYGLPRRSVLCSQLCSKGGCTAGGACCSAGGHGLTTAPPLPSARGSFNGLRLWLDYMIPPMRWMTGSHTEGALF